MPIYLTVRPQHEDHPSTEVFDYELDQDEVLVGRAEAVDLRLPHKSVSLVHGRLLRADGRLRYTDLNSTNGSLVDGHSVGSGQSREVGIGSRMLIGPFEVRLVSRDSLTGPSADRDTSSYARQMVVDLLQALGGESIPTLEWTSGPDRGRRHQLAVGSTSIIGRSEDCDVQLHDADASRRHAEFRSGPQGVMLADRDSKNGVRVNDQQIQGPQTLADGDRIRIGATELRFIDPAEEVLADLQQEGDEPSAQRPRVRSAGPDGGAPRVQSSRSGELRQVEPQEQALSPSSAQELGGGDSVVPGSQVPSDGEPAVAPSQRTDVVLLVAGGLVVAGALGLIAYVIL